MKRRVFDETFRQMARPGVPVDLSYAKGSVRQAAEELGIDSGRISKWRQRDNKPAPSGKSNTDLTDEQKQIRQLQKQLKEAQLERDISRQSASFPGATARRTVGDIPIYKGTCQSVFHGPPLRLRRCVKY